MDTFTLEQLHTFILHAKAATYIGSGAQSPSTRPASHDLRFSAGNFAYIDSYFGGSDFLGEEIVYFAGLPVWGENYYGRLLHPDLIQADQVGQILKEGLSRMYATGRFLGGWQHTTPLGVYTDASQGDLTAFTGVEWVERHGLRLYELNYHGGLIR